jgi:hypothetical protein
MRVGAHRKRVEDVLSRVPLSSPWTVAEFLGWLAEETQRKIELSPWEGQPDEPGGRCGLLLGTADRYIIKYDATRSVRHQRQQIFHECAHVLCRHEGEPFRPTASVLTQGLDLSAIEFMMRRATFDSPTEAEAEMVGTQLAVLSCGPIDGVDGRLHRVIEPWNG